MGFDQIAAGIGDRARRRILVELLDHNPVAVETAGTADGDGHDEIQLTHTHLPKLEDMGYIAWDRDHEAIMKGPNWEEIEPVVRLLHENGDRTPDDTF